MSNNFTNYKTINQFYRMDITTNQNQPFGIAEFYKLGPQPYCLAPKTCHGFQPVPYNEYQKYIDARFANSKISDKPNKYGIYYTT